MSGCDGCFYLTILLYYRVRFVYCLFHHDIFRNFFCGVTIIESSKIYLCKMRFYIFIRNNILSLSFYGWIKFYKLIAAIVLKNPKNIIVVIPQLVIVGTINDPIVVSRKNDYSGKRCLIRFLQHLLNRWITRFKPGRRLEFMVR